MNRLVIVGAGPAGLHAAVHAVNAGFDVTILERGKVAEAVRRWQHVRLFTPFEMNSTEAGRRAAGSQAQLPTSDAILSGGEYVQQYLFPLARSSLLRGCLRTHTTLTAASRQTAWKTHHIGTSERDQSPFRLLVSDQHGAEQILECDILLDCSGFTERHRFVGAGGIPCPGECTYLAEEDYQIAAIDRPAETGKHIAVIGSGYSAATSVCNLHGTGHTVFWITRGERSVPVTEIADDPLAERQTLAQRANQLAARNDSRVHWLPDRLVQAMYRNRDAFLIELTQGDGSGATLTCDRIVANPGFRPDSRPFEELQIHRCWATDGPMKTAAHLLGESSADCLNQQVPSPDLLHNPEPHFYVVGAASYGRHSQFLLQNGLDQIAQLFASLPQPEEPRR